jgi:peptidoglycan/LPS O-acetylase OafA/YrhL
MLRRLDRLLMVWGGLLLAALGFALARAWAGVALPFSYPLYLAVFFSGMIWFRIDRDHPDLRARVIIPVIVAALGVVALVSRLVFGAATIGEDTALSHFGNHAVAVGLFFLLGRGLRVTAPPVVFVGHVSYSLYLVHTAVPLLIAAALPGLPHAGLLSAMAAFPVAIALHYGVERPSIRLARDLARRVQGRPTVVCSG